MEAPKTVDTVVEQTLDEDFRIALGFHLGKGEIKRLKFKV
jgi:hypothetical protein